MPVYALGDLTPAVDPSAFVHPDAVVIGAVTIGPGASIWPCAVLRGDGGRIVIGARTSIQDGAILHCTAELDTVVGEDCVIGHGAHLEGCIVHAGSLVGSGSIVLHRVSVGPHALVGAGALVAPGTVVPARARALGIPARVTPDAVEPGAFADNTQTYAQQARRYLASLRRID